MGTSGGRASMDHPRMRGEEALAMRRSQITYGSPPHARGGADAETDGAGHRRITPACAGRSARSGRGSSRCADHPRMRGEECAASVAL